MSTSTDSSFSIAANEFVWADDAPTAAHAYLTPAVLDLLRKSRAKTVLDLGCGNGAFTAVLQQHGYAVQGCDMSTSALECARRAHPRIDFFLQNVGEPLPIPYIGRFDAVVSVEVIEHLLLPRQLARSAFEALRPGGVFVVTTPYHSYLKNLALALTNKFDEHWHPLRDFGHVKFFSKNTLLALLRESGFELGAFRRVGRIPALACSMIAEGVKRA